MSTNYVQAVEPGVWCADRSRSTVGFRVRRVEARDHGLHVEGHVDAASVQTGNPIRDRRLRSEFFDVESHPTISLLASGDEGDRRLSGELTMRGVSRPVELALTADAERDGTVRLRAEGTIRRSDFGLEWEALREAGRLLVADEVHLSASVVLMREPACRIL